MTLITNTPGTFTVSPQVEEVATSSQEQKQSHHLPFVIRGYSLQNDEDHRAPA